MTGEYKENLINWLTGNFTTTSYNERVVQIGQTINQNILREYLSTHYTTTNCAVIKNVKSTVNGNILSLLYDQDNSRSIIIIFDEKLNPIQLITRYSSGTLFAHILTINVGEDGNFFLIENTGSNKRFVMCNNITAGDINNNYKVVLRKSYNVGGNLVNLINAYEIIKYPNQSKYLVIGTDNDTTSTINIINEIVVNVGIPNEYNNFTFSSTPIATTYLDIYYNVNEENINFCIAAAGNNTTNAYNELKNSGYVVSITSYELESPSVKAVKLNYTDACISVYDWDTYKYNFYYLKNGIKTLTGTFQTNGGRLAPRIQAWSINKINDVIYGIILGDYDSNNYQIRGFTIVDTTFRTNGLSEGVGQDLFYFNMIMASSINYDLYNFVYAFGNLTTTSYIIYNEGRYNGDSYIDYNYFIPSYSIITDGTKPIFSRGLYNFTILENNSTATINVPNMYLNNINFIPYLYGETSGNLVISGETYQKNIYENLLINFNNSITITNDDLYMNTPSARLNNSILNQLDYNNAKLGWARINYTNNIRELPITLNQVNQYKYYINFVIMAGSDIDNIMILSEDKQTVYDNFTIDYEIGKIYSIQRTVEII